MLELTLDVLGVPAPWQRRVLSLAVGWLPPGGSFCSMCLVILLLLGLQNYFSSSFMGRLPALPNIFVNQHQMFSRWWFKLDYTGDSH